MARYTKKAGLLNVIITMVNALPYRNQGIVLFSEVSILLYNEDLVLIIHTYRFFKSTKRSLIL